MRVKVVPADKGGCALYRCELPTEALRDEVDVGLNFKVKPVFEDTPAGPRRVGLMPLGFDVAVFARPLERTRVELMEQVREYGVATVVEIDDDMKSVPRDNAVWSRLQPHLHDDMNWRWLERAARNADHVTVTTPALAERYGSHGRVSVIPNYVPDWYLDVDTPRNERLTVGWAGFVGTHPHDLKVLRGITDVLRRHDAEFVQIGCNNAQKVLGIPDEHFRHIPSVPLKDYPATIAQFDVGLAPLEFSSFNQAKSWLKPLEYSAVGVPWIASATRPYLDFREQAGVGATVRNFAEWEKELDRLLGDESLRREQAARGRQVVDEKFTVSGNRHRWRQAWEQAYEHRQQFPVTGKVFNPFTIEQRTGITALKKETV